MSDILIDGLPYPLIVAESAAPAVSAAVGSGTSAAIVTDRHVTARAAAIARALRAGGARVLGSHALAGGERIKNAAHLRALWSWLLEAGADRATTIIAVGGGTITDLAGFAAATYMRGIAWVAVPTTVLGMADAAIGGKTAIDLPQGKNLAGAFWPPRAVVADLRALATLPERERVTGLAEIVKAAVIADPGLLDAVRGLGPATTGEGAWRDAIVRAARVKADLVAADPFERDARSALNLGHTVGHALEHASGGKLSHGQAVAVGLRAAGLAALDAGMFSAREHARVLQTLRGAGLPLQYGSIPVSAIHSALRVDKKRRQGALAFVLPERIGKVKIGVTVEDSSLRTVLRQCAGPPRAEELEE